MKTILTSFLLSFFAFAYSQENPPVVLTLSAIRTVVNNQITRYNGTEKGVINISLHTNGTFGYTIEGGPGGRSNTTYGSYNLVGNKIKLNYDNGTTQEFTIIKMDDVVTKLIAGERAMYFIRSRGN